VERCVERRSELVSMHACMHACMHEGGEREGHTRPSEQQSTSTVCVCVCVCDDGVITKLIDHEAAHDLVRPTVNVDV
jgi:hypothetical protein